MASHYHEPPVDLPSPHDSSSDDDDDDHAAILDLHAVVVASNSYDAHVNYINALRKAAELDKLRLARELMDACYPLTPNMWLDWCEDESRLATREKGKQVEYIRNLFHRQLRIPLADHALTLEQYKDWEQQQGVQIGAENDDLPGLPRGVICIQGSRFNEQGTSHI